MPTTKKRVHIPKDKFAKIKEEIKRRYMNHRDPKVLAAELGISLATLRRNASKLGVSRKVNADGLATDPAYRPSGVAEPTTMRPGSAGKVAVLAQRLAEGKPLYSDNDYMGG